jgi:DNA-binding cell septation regulator SpoVG
MNHPCRISGVRFISAQPHDVAAGLLGYVSAIIDDRLYLDGITVRRTAAGRTTLSFPERRNRRGDAFPYMRPVNAAARDDIERAILGAIGMGVTP